MRRGFRFVKRPRPSSFLAIEPVGNSAVAPHDRDPVAAIRSAEGSGHWGTAFPAISDMGFGLKYRSRSIFKPPGPVTDSSSDKVK